MKPIDDEIEDAISKGFELKDIASKSTEKPDLYREAAKYFKKAAFLLAKEAQDASNSLDGRIESKVLSYYYSSAANNCLWEYYYQKFNYEKSVYYLQKCLKEINTTIEFAESQLSGLSLEIQDHIKQQIKDLHFAKMNFEIQLLSTDARKHFRNDEFIEALDLYRRIAALLKNVVDYAKQQNLTPAYERISVGNYLAFMGNASAALAGIMFLQKQKTRVGKDSFDLAVIIIRCMLDVNYLVQKAYLTNPERAQYYANARAALRNIAQFFAENKDVWLDLYIEFENENEVLKIMKHLDLELFNNIEETRHPLHKVKTEGLEPDEQNIFRKEDDRWFIRYDGKTIEPNDSKGLAYIAYALGKPGQELSAIKVYLEVEKPPVWKINMLYSQMTQEQLAEHGLIESFPDAGIELADKKALADYQREFKKLQKEYKEILQERQKARENDDPSYTEEMYLEDKRRVEEEMQKLAKHIQSVTDRKGEIRETADEIERIRKSITMAISRARKKIKDKYKHESLAIHLQAIKTGRFVSYKPEDPPDWQL